MKLIFINGLLCISLLWCSWQPAVCDEYDTCIVEKIEGRNEQEAPLMGWNSFDSYGVYLHEKAAFENLEELAKKYKKFGYEYFVIDNGWFGEYNLQPGTIFSAELHASDVHINQNGLLQPSKCYFPNGFSALITRCHELGLKFGLHLMRGIPRKAVRLNLPIKGTSWHARDIADTMDICNWCPYNYGVDMTKPGAQEFYNSLVDQLAEWGVDFIKADDIVPYPKEIEGLAEAIRQSGRDIKLSLSPGKKADPANVNVYNSADMLRVTTDIWDTARDIDKCFNAWEKWSEKTQYDFWIDMDMIPFGQLQLMSPIDSCSKNIETVQYAGRGNTRKSQLTVNQQLTFITLRALSASPLMIGGDLPSMDEYSYRLLTNREMLRCNQNGVIGRRIYHVDKIQVWKVVEKYSNNGWIGIFNRSKETQSVCLSSENLKISLKSKLKDIWNDTPISWKGNELSLYIPSEGVIFIRYSMDTD